MTELAGKRILIVEDEALLAMTVEDILSDLGCIVVGPAMSLEEAQTLAAQERLDAAVLDVNVDGASSFDVADILGQRLVPFCFITGYGAASLPPQYADVPVLAKPYGDAALRAVLRRLLASG